MALVAVVARRDAVAFVPQVVQTIEGNGAKPIAEGETFASFSEALAEAQRMRAGIISARARRAKR